jgi:hypothetical protein
MKKIVLIALPVVLLGVGAGLVLTGIIKVPGLSPKGKAAAKANQLYAETKDPKDPKNAKTAKDDKKVEEKKPVVAKAPPKEDKKTPPPQVDAAVLVENKPEVGQKKLAKLWGEMEVPALNEITKDWKDPELAAVLVKMDSAKVAELLAVMEPKRASKISRELQKQASIVPRATGA